MTIRFSNKPRPIVTLTEIHLERIPILRKLRQVLFSDRMLDAFLLGRIGYGDAGAGETAAIEYKPAELNEVSSRREDARTCITDSILCTTPRTFSTPPSA